MDLSEAIKVVAKFAAKGRNAPELYKSILFLPGAKKDELGRVFTTDGVSSCWVTVECPLMKALIPVGNILPLSKYFCAMEAAAGTEATFKGDSGGLWKVPIRDLSAYPLPAICPELVTWENWDSIWPVFHVAAAPKSSFNSFKWVRIGPQCSEATDASRVSVVSVASWDKPKMVPAMLFTGWKDGKVSLGFQDDFVWARKGEETRYSFGKSRAQFPDCHAQLPDCHDWPTIVVDVKDLAKAVDAAKGSSGNKAVQFSFNGKSVVVQSWNDPDNGYRRAVLGESDHVPELPIIKIVSGKFILEALAVMKTPNVRICYQNCDDGPIRLESGTLAVGIWPWRVVEIGTTSK